MKWLIELHNFFIVYMIVQSAVTIRTFSYECIRSIEPIPQISVLLVEMQSTLIWQYLCDKWTWSIPGKYVGMVYLCFLVLYPLLFLPPSSSLCSPNRFTSTLVSYFIFYTAIVTNFYCIWNTLISPCALSFTLITAFFFPLIAQRT